MEVARRDGAEEISFRTLFSSMRCALLIVGFGLGLLFIMLLLINAFCSYVDVEPTNDSVGRFAGSAMRFFTGLLKIIGVALVLAFIISAMLFLLEVRILERVAFGALAGRASQGGR